MNTNLTNLTAYQKSVAALEMRIGKKLNQGTRIQPPCSAEKTAYIPLSKLLIKRVG